MHKLNNNTPINGQHGANFAQHAPQPHLNPHQNSINHNTPSPIGRYDTKPHFEEIGASTSLSIVASRGLIGVHSSLMESDLPEGVKKASSVGLGILSLVGITGLSWLETAARVAFAAAACLILVGTSSIEMIGRSLLLMPIAFLQGLNTSLTLGVQALISLPKFALQASSMLIVESVGLFSNRLANKLQSHLPDYQGPWGIDLQIDFGGALFIGAGAVLEKIGVMSLLDTLGVRKTASDIVDLVCDFKDHFSPFDSFWSTPDHPLFSAIIRSTAINLYSMDVGVKMAKKMILSFKPFSIREVTWQDSRRDAYNFRRFLLENQ